MSPQADHPKEPWNPSPLDLIPTTPLKPARRARRLVHGNDETHQLRHVLLATPTTTSNNNNNTPDPLLAASPPIVGYTFNSLIIQAPNTGVALFLATPMTESGHCCCCHDDSSNDNPIPCLVSCGVGSVVIKAVHHQCFSDDPLKEIAAMQLLPPHRHIISLLDCMRDERYIYLVMSYLPGGDVFSRVQAAGDGGLPEEQPRSYFMQICQGLVFMKSHGIAHHDVSLENIMLDNQDQVKIIDMGMCLRVPTPPPHDGVVHLAPQRCCGKPSYVAPEVVGEEACDPFASDVWSLGVCLYMMLVGRPLYSSPSDPAFKLMARGRVRAVVDAYEMYGLPPLPSCAKDLICLMLHADPTKRPTLEEVLNHPFLLSGMGGPEE